MVNKPNTDSTMPKQTATNWHRTQHLNTTVLPQTGEKLNTNTTVMGAVLLGFTAILGLGIKSRKRED